MTLNGAAFAMQWEGDVTVDVPLLGLWPLSGRPGMCEAGPGEVFAMQGYAGSIAAFDAGIPVLSSHGGAAMIFDATGARLATHRRTDISGVAAAGNGFAMTDGLGVVWACDASGLTPLAPGTTILWR